MVISTDVHDGDTWVWERIQIEETEGKEETQKAACKLVWLDPHPVVMMDMCVCVHLCVLEREAESQTESLFLLQTPNRYS